MIVAADAWLTRTLGRPSFVVHAAAAPPAALLEALAAHTAAPDAFYFAKVPVLNVDAVKALECAGFSVVETSLTFSRSSDAPPASAPGGVAVGPLQPQWREGALDIAGSAFKYTRFHVDPKVGLVPAHRLKREWIQSYVNGTRGDALLVAHDGNRVLGFSAMLTIDRADQPAAVIDLIAVHPDYQQRGIGVALIEAGARHYQSRYPSIEVTTQASNIPSVRLYERVGFRLIRSTFVLHRHGRG
jgi:ribosomal protein S18 acetylase RimI-like enzyme